MAKKDNFMSGVGGLALWVILKGMTAKPVESSWLNAVLHCAVGGWLVWNNFDWQTQWDLVGLSVGWAFVLRGVIFAINQTIRLVDAHEERKTQEQARQQAEEEAAPAPSRRRRAPRTPSARVAVAPVVEPSPRVAPAVGPTAKPVSSSCSPVGAAYGATEESPILAEPVEEPAAPISPAAEEEREDEENNSPTLPPAVKPLSGKRVCVTGKLPYKRRDVEDFITAMGGTLSRRPTRRTDWLVMGEDGGTKIDEAERYGIPQIDFADLLALCGLPADADIIAAMPRDHREARRQTRLSSEEAREYGREFRRRVNLLTEIMTSAVSDLLPKVVQVVQRVDDELELCRVSSFRSTAQGELVLLSTEGEAIYLNDLTGDSVVRLLGVYGR